MRTLVRLGAVTAAPPGWVAESGRTPAEAAAEAGFADQSHLTRWFRRYYAITPARFRDAALGQSAGS
ncbi:helix-turn-helix domain-containing protein [Saccharopolyspora tripterygii]